MASLYDAPMLARNTTAELVQPISVRFQHALHLPLAQKCYKIARIVDDGSLKELQPIFPMLIDNIFGIDSQFDWGLKTISRALHVRDFEVLREFLSPKGPLFCLIYKLMSDVNIRYDFPVVALPVPARKAIEDGVVPMMYANKLQISIPGKMPQSVHLNPFEYYFFHFSYYLINPYNLKVISNWTSPGEAVYPMVVNDYLEYFLPVDGSIIDPVYVCTLPRSSIQYPQTFNNTLSPGLIRSPATPHHSLRLLRNQNILKSPIQSPIQLSEQPQMESWRSEIMTQIFVEMWLTQNTVENTNHNLMIQTHHLPNARYSNISSFHHPLYCFENFCVNCDHVRTVRMLVKHFHFFANSYTVGSMSSLEEFKRIVIPQLFQNKFYSFLQYCTANWPLDAAFRLVLETWLSYIQPWRYMSKQNFKPNNMMDDEKDRTVDLTWQKFVMENLAFYTIIFQRMLPRFFRMDLSTPKNSYMLYRITKVYSQPNLVNLIRDAENSYMEPLTHVPDDHSFAMSRSPINPALVAMVRQQLFELERPGFQYVPLFGQELRLEIQQLLSLVNQARSMVEDTSIVSDNKKPGFMSHVKKFVTFVLDSGVNYGRSEDYPPHGKVDQYLITASVHLSNIFNIQPPQTYESFAGDIMGDHTVDNSKSWLQKPFQPPAETVILEGNPDLQPIRSYEIAFLVRFFYQFCNNINDKYRLELRRLYHRPDFVGFFCRQFLADPVIYYEYDKSNFPPVRAQKVLPPRISLRPLAHRQLIGYFFCLLIVAWIWDYHPILMIIFMVFVIVTVAAIRAGFKLFKQLRTNRHHLHTS